MGRKYWTGSCVILCSFVIDALFNNSLPLNPRNDKRARDQSSMRGGVIKLYHERLAMITVWLRWKLGLACCWPLDLISHVLIERIRSFIRRSKVHSGHELGHSWIRAIFMRRIVPLVVVLGTCPRTCFPIHERALLISTRAIFLLVQLHVRAY